ncbi:spore germination protein [Salirhabdus sp. Marseille-P4669]|uniref:spore germination protein n=1 Tax=Salirhabdus sp. Marseille-P4669 TaxID=2042310 RepID=UPI000C7B0FCA|nr:spore germination protein [Salirhabdus sp. Marseille-P4669]
MGKKASRKTIKLGNKSVKNNHENVNEKKTTEPGLQMLMELKKQFKGDDDFVVYEFSLFGQYSATIVYLTSMVDKEMINKDIMKVLSRIPNPNKNPNAPNLKKYIQDHVLYLTGTKEEHELSSITNGVLQGKTALLVHSFESVFLFDTYKENQRSITEPESEQVIRGPREGFIESITANISLLRKRLPTADFRINYHSVGELTKSKVAIVYLDGIVNGRLVKEVKRRLDQIKIDRILDSGYIEQFIEDNPRSPFPQVRNTERPDVAVGNLAEGRVVILVDGSPNVLIVPATFNTFYQTSEDYNMRFIMATLVRWIRLAALLFSLLMPSLYVALISFHPELIPTSFAVAVMSGRAGIPFPAVVEVFLMEGAMEVLREATIRMPKQIGSALSIVGVLVVGDAAVSAGFVSPITVVVIALTSIGSFATPSYNMAIGFRMVRFPLLLITGILGFYGFILGVLLINNHLISLKSFGVPYMAPVTPMNFGGIKDTLFRAPLHAMKDRPEYLLPIRKKRIQGNQLNKGNPLQPTQSKENKRNDKK